MPKLNIKTTHKPVQAFYVALDQFQQLGVAHETAVRSAFQSLLASCARQFQWTLVPEFSLQINRDKRILLDGALLDVFHLTHGWWEAKDIHDDLPAEVRRKFQAGYPKDNILFQTPKRAILWQDNRCVLDADLTDPKQLVQTLETFFAYHPPAIAEWEKAVALFKDKVHEIGKGLAKLLQKEQKINPRFADAFTNFFQKMRLTINPNLAEAAVQEMLIQHLLTERIFRTVFDNPEFTRRNAIANEIETVIHALTSQSFSRREFFQSLNRFYTAIERTAETIEDFSRKQHFLNTVYEQFFQGFSVQVADTHGIVYTPQPIVDFMVKSIEHILKTEFRSSLSHSGVHIIDPFVGTGNFIVRIMREIRKTALEHKYKQELHCNEVLLLPYYIAAMNIEREFYEATERYQPFEGLCFVDTFELAEDRQLALFTEENTRRAKRQKETEIFVIVGNPPYNAGQVNENDNNKNRQYKTIDQRVRNTYAKDSNATLKNSLFDPYVKAIRWASDRIGEEGIIAFVTNNSFIDGFSFDGMRRHLANDFDAIYILDLGGNARKGLQVSDSNVFGIRVGVSISLFAKTKRKAPEQARIFYYRTDDLWNREKKFDFLYEQCINDVQWELIQPDNRHAWLTKELQSDFDTFIPIGNKTTKAADNGNGAVGAIFKTYSNGVTTSRDAWACNFQRNALLENMQRMIDTYNVELDRWKRLPDPKGSVDDFVISDGRKIKWTDRLKQELEKEKDVALFPEKVRSSLYRPFTKSYLYFDRLMNQRVCVFPSIFPTTETEKENQVIIVPGLGGRTDHWCFCAQIIPNLTLTTIDGSQCFPFYTYDEDGTNRQENITDWAWKQFQSHYQDNTISKWDIFHYIYALLHHPDYRKRYQANLKRDLPRIPFAPDFQAFAKAGGQLAELHLRYEDQPEYPLDLIETPDTPLSWRVEKMRLSKDKTQIQYNDFLTLDGIPPTVFDYRLGNRSALEWVLDQYRVKEDKRSGIINDPNRPNDKKYIVHLIQKVITVSLETLKIIEALPSLETSPPLIQQPIAVKGKHGKRK